MTAQATPILTPGYTCSFCRQTFTQTGPRIIGEPPEDRIGKVTGMLAAHLAKEHKQEFAQLALAGQQMTGWFFTTRFSHNDPEMEKFSEAVRLQIRKITKRVVIPDEAIEKQIAAFLAADHGDLQRDLTDLLKGMRDALDEAVSPAGQA